MGQYTIYVWLPVAAILSVAVFCDVKSQKIPNRLTYPSAVIGIVLQVLMCGASGLLFSIGGLLLGLAMLLPFYSTGGMGAGDVKLMGALGAFLGPKGVFIAFLFTALAGGIYALALFAFHGYLKDTLVRYGLMLKMIAVGHKFTYIPAPPEKEGKPKLCYGVAIAFGTMTSLFIKFI